MLYIILLPPLPPPTAISSSSPIRNLEKDPPQLEEFYFAPSFRGEDTMKDFFNLGKLNPTNTKTNTGQILKHLLVERGMKIELKEHEHVRRKKLS